MTDPIQRYTEAVEMALHPVLTFTPRGSMTGAEIRHYSIYAIKEATYTLVEELCGEEESEIEDPMADESEKSYNYNHEAIDRNQLRSEILTKAKGLKG